MERDSDKLEVKGRTRMQWLSAILVNTTALTYGLQWGWISPMTKILQSDTSPLGRPLTDTEMSFVAGLPSLAGIIGLPISQYLSDKYGRRNTVILIAVLQLSDTSPLGRPLTDTEMSFVAGLPSLAGIIGLPISQYLSDKYGRRNTVILIAVLQLVGWILMIPANVISLLVARLISGLGSAGGFHVVPIYVKEISQDDIRGALGSIVIMFQNLGVLIMYGLGSYFSYYTILYLTTGLSILTTAMLFKVPESPSFLVNQNKPEEAAAAVSFLRSLNVDDKKVKTEIDLIKKENDRFKSLPNISFFKILKNKAWRRGFIISALIAILRGMNGSFAIISYASPVLDISDIGISSDLQSLAIPVFLTIGTAITMSSVDKLGRKMLLGVTFLVSTIILCALAIDVLLRDRGWATFTWIPIVAIIIIVFCYGAGVAPIWFIIMTEMFNYQIRGKLAAYLCMLAFSTNFLQLITFTSITNVFGVHVSFFTFGAVNLIGVLLALVFLPETKGKSVDEIETKLRKLTHLPKMCTN